MWRPLSAIALACCSLMLTVAPALAVTSDEAGQMDIWDAPSTSDTTGPQPTPCTFSAAQPLVPKIDAVFSCSQPERYGRDRSGQTYCNAYATVVLDVMLPDDMAQLRTGLGQNHPSVLADNFYDFFSTHWAVISPLLSTDQRVAQAQYYADAGYVVVASEPGHIAFVESSTVPYAQTTVDSLLLSQGGATAGRDIPLSRAWRASAISSQVMFFYKQPGAVNMPVVTLAQMNITQTKMAEASDTPAASSSPAPTQAVPPARRSSEGDL
jgi:hypothetical protein